MLCRVNKRKGCICRTFSQLSRLVQNDGMWLYQGLDGGLFHFFIYLLSEFYSGGVNSVLCGSQRTKWRIWRERISVLWQDPLYMWALLPQHMVYTAVFPVHSLTIYHCTSHVYMLDVCAVLYCVYAAGYLLLHIVLVCLMLTGCSGLSRHKICGFSLSLTFICLFCPLYDTDLHCLTFILMFKPRNPRSLSTAVFLSVCVNAYLCISVFGLCIVFCALFSSHNTSENPVSNINKLPHIDFTLVYLKRTKRWVHSGIWRVPQEPDDV